ncbi:MATE family efflux transporter [Halorussus halophilus]|uniref:MATE family efflux transporter n=1 Tax=Halorussus halophilus TaxID=2650975 RepID=UPI001301088C|nr:MATE family efflux transporter [Halorussus halophilus]
MLDVSREDITDGSLVHAMLVLATPLVVQNVVHVVQSIVDTFWVGRLGEDAVAAVGASFPVIALIASVTVVVFSGTQVLVSQRAGSENLDGARRATFHGLTLGLVAGTTVAALVFLGVDTIVEIVLTGNDVAPLAATYIATLVLVFPFMGMSDAIEGGFVGWGDSQAAMYVNVVAVAVNITLDPFLIFGFTENPLFAMLGLGGLQSSLYASTGFSGFEIAGAAMATAIGYFVGFLLALAMYVRGRDGFTVTSDVIGFETEEYREILDIGLPSGGQTVAAQSVRVLIIAVISAVGASAGLAAYNVGAQVATVAFVPAQGLRDAAQSVVGQNLGADNPERAQRATWTGATIAAVGLTLVGVFQWVAPEFLVNLFVPAMSPDGFELAVDYLRILVLGYWGIGAMYLFNAGFNGARKTKVSMMASLLKYWAVRLPIAAVGAMWLDLGVRAVFWGVTISNVVGAVGLGLYYYYTTNNGMLRRAADKVSSPAD